MHGVGREDRNLLGMVVKPNLAADSDYAGRVSMGTCALCNTLPMVGNNMEGLGMELGREARNLLGMILKTNLSADSDLAGRVSMGTCAFCNILPMVGSNMVGLGMGLGRGKGTCWRCRALGSFCLKSGTPGTGFCSSSLRDFSVQ